MYTIGKLAKGFGLSRSTLLYYDSIGLLRPTGRTDSNYRTYSEEEVKRLEHICRYRQAGVPLEDIQKILEAPENATVSVLKKRLDELNRQIKLLRDQQQVIFRLLKNDTLVKEARVLDKESWIEILHAAGLDQATMEKWHVEFERLSPEGHQEFMESLGIPQEEIKYIRMRCRESLQSEESYRSNP
jgi:DNA-binding transcriptional MerR regulator